MRVILNFLNTKQLRRNHIAKSSSITKDKLNQPFIPHNIEIMHTH